MTGSHWSRIARLWGLVGPPLRPAAQDIAVFQDAIDRWIASHGGAPRALILGVTPELHSLRWPAGTSLQALDGSQQMIGAVWPGPPGTAIQGSWTAIPLAARSCDMVFCDGGFGLLSYPRGQMDMLRELRRVLPPGGIFAMRLFAPGGKTGTVDEVFADLDAGRIASLDALKLRLWGALQGDGDQSVRPRDVAACILAAKGSFDCLAEDHGWPLEHVRSLELHRDSTLVYHLTGPAEVVRMTCDEGSGFAALDIIEPAYPMGACCPVLILQRV